MFKKITLFVFLLTLSLSSFRLYAQQADISGHVVSDSGNSLAGVTVFNTKSEESTQTSDEGLFTIKASIGDVLIFRYVGFSLHEHTVQNLTPLTINLHPQDEMIEEVVIMGYGTVKRNKVTASVSTLDSKILETGVRANPAQALSGTIPGVRVSTTSGRPGSMPDIVLRGGTHFDGSGSPLILVDGQVRGSLSDISPDQIGSAALRSAGTVP